MKNLDELISDIQSDQKFRMGFLGKTRAEIDSYLKEKGYDVTVEECIERAEKMNYELTPEQLEKISGGKSTDELSTNLSPADLAITIGAIGCGIAHCISNHHHMK